MVEFQEIDDTERPGSHPVFVNSSSVASVEAMKDRPNVSVISLINGRLLIVLGNPTHIAECLEEECNFDSSQ